MDAEVPRRGKKPPQGEPVVVRALSLLAAFDAEHRALGLADLSRRARIPRSTLRLDAAAVTELRRRLTQVRRLGIAIFDRSHPAPMSSIAAPVGNHEDQVGGRAVDRGPGPGAAARSYEQVVRATALAISRGMGLSRP
jgi:DNA-binding IclR family transcriptional regulator